MMGYCELASGVLHVLHALNALPSATGISSLAKAYTRILLVESLVTKAWRDGLNV